MNIYINMVVILQGTTNTLSYIAILYLHEPIMPSVLGGKYCNSNKTNSHSNQKHLNYNTYSKVK